MGATAIAAPIDRLHGPRGGRGRRVLRPTKPGDSGSGFAARRKESVETVDARYGEQAPIRDRWHRVGIESRERSFAPAGRFAFSAGQSQPLRSAAPLPRFYEIAPRYEKSCLRAHRPVCTESSCEFGFESGMCARIWDTYRAAGSEVVFVAKVQSQARHSSCVSV